MFLCGRYLQVAFHFAGPGMVYSWFLAAVFTYTTGQRQVETIAFSQWLSKQQKCKPLAYSEHNHKGR